MPLQTPSSRFSLRVTIYLGVRQYFAAWCGGRIGSVLVNFTQGGIVSPLRGSLLFTLFLGLFCPCFPVEDLTQLVSPIIIG